MVAIVYAWHVVPCHCALCLVYVYAWCVVNTMCCVWIVRIIIVACAKVCGVAAEKGAGGRRAVLDEVVQGKLDERVQWKVD